VAAPVPAAPPPQGSATGEEGSRSPTSPRAPARCTIRRRPRTRRPAAPRHRGAGPQRPHGRRGPPGGEFRRGRRRGRRLRAGRGIRRFGSALVRHGRLRLGRLRGGDDPEDQAELGRARARALRRQGPAHDSLLHPERRPRGGERILSGSGTPPFDNAAFQAISRSSAFRPLPDDLGHDREGVTVTFFYNLRPETSNSPARAGRTEGEREEEMAAINDPGEIDRALRTAKAIAVVAARPRRADRRTRSRAISCAPATT